jgi:hypothetical protein
LYAKGAGEPNAPKAFFDKDNRPTGQISRGPSTRPVDPGTLAIMIQNNDGESRIGDTEFRERQRLP